jgi:membrane protease YdiL (CAAX protease family)
VLANLGETRRTWRILTFACLALLNLVVFLLALVVVAVPFLSRPTLVPMSPALEGFGFTAFGAGGIATSVLGLLSLAPPVRRLLARYSNINPDSPVHTAATSFLLYLTSASLGTLVGAGPWLSESLELVSSSTWAIVGGQALFVLLAVAGVGLGIRRSLGSTVRRLGLGRLSLQFLGIAALAVVAFLALDYVTSVVWHTVWPSSYQSVMASAQRLYARFATPLGALTLGVAAGIGEETLFRGALQPVFGIPLTALAFALGHIQYGLSPATAEILIIGLALGWLRNRTNTTTCVLVHLAYNFLDLLIAPLFP